MSGSVGHRGLFAGVVLQRIRDHGPWQSNGDCMWCDVWPHSVGGPVTHAPGCVWLEVVAATNPPEQEGPS